MPVDRCRPVARSPSAGRPSANGPGHLPAAGRIAGVMLMAALSGGAGFGVGGPLGATAAAAQAAAGPRQAATIQETADTQATAAAQAPATKQAAAATQAPATKQAAAAAGPTIELNRLEDAGGGCRLTLVVANPGTQRFEQLKLDLVLFDRDGVVARRLAVETGPVRANKTVVRLFEAADLPCAGIGRLLLNDVLACAGDTGPVAGCVDRIATASRAAVPFER